MLFAKPYYPVILNFGLHSFSVAVVENANGAAKIKSLQQCPISDIERQNQLLLEAKNNLSVRTKFLRAFCYVTPEERLVRRVELDGSKHADTGYLSEIATNQLRIDADQYDLAVLDSTSGTPIDTNTKSAVFAGLPSNLAIDIQNSIVARGIYPERIGLSSINEIGAYHSILKTDSTGTPTLILEIGATTSNAYIICKEGLEATKSINQGIDSMMPVIQKELGLKDEESARKLLQSNAFDFTSMSVALTKRLVKELQSSIGFFEVQTGLSISQLCCVGLPENMSWFESSIENQLGLKQLALTADKIQIATQLNFNSELVNSSSIKGILTAASGFQL